MKSELVEYDNYDEIYIENIKADISSGKFFNDGFDYFLTAYLRPITDRTFFMFVGLTSAVIIWYVVSLVSSILPLKEEINIVIKERDITKYWLNIKDLQKYGVGEKGDSTDESILKYLLMNYVSARETHNYIEGNITQFNDSLAFVKNNSNQDVDNEFRWFMSKANEEGPYYYFGKDIESKIDITDFRFIRIRKGNLITRIKNYFNVANLPISAEVYYTLSIRIGENITKSKRKSVLNFSYAPIKQDKNNKYTLPPSFTILGYQNYMLK